MSGCQPATPEQIARERAKMGVKSEQPKVEMRQAALSGVWDTPLCEYDSEMEFYRLDQLEIVSNYIENATTFFSDSKCLSKNYTKKFTGFFVLSGESIGITYSTIYLTPENGTFSGLFNAKSLCSIQDWKIGEMRTLTDFKVCGYESAESSTVQRYGSNELFLGNRKFILSKKTTELQ